MNKKWIEIWNLSNEDYEFFIHKNISNKTRNKKVIKLKGTWVVG